MAMFKIPTPYIFYVVVLILSLLSAATVLAVENKVPISPKILEGFEQKERVEVVIVFKELSDEIHSLEKMESGRNQHKLKEDKIREYVSIREKRRGAQNEKQIKDYWVHCTHSFSWCCLW